MSVITVSRELGSLGTFVAGEAARRLGCHLADKATLESMLNVYGMGWFREEYGRVPGFWERLDYEKAERRRNVLEMVSDCMRALARHGDVVLVGRGGFAVLAGLSDVLHVRVQAPLDVRLARLKDVPGIESEEKAREAVLESDRLQAAYIKSVFGLEWDRARCFDLVLDTGKLSPQWAARMVAESAQALRREPRPGPGAAELTEDKLLASLVFDVLHCETAHVV